MNYNKKILHEWGETIKKYKRLTLKQAQEIYIKLKKCNNPKLKKELRDELITGTLYQVYNFINKNGYTYIKSISFDMNDIISATIESWIKLLDSGDIMDEKKFMQQIKSSFYKNVNENLGTKFEINPKEYLYSKKAFIDLIVDYINIKEVNPHFDYYELSKYIKENLKYHELLRGVNNAYYELEQLKNGKRLKNTEWEKYQTERVNKYDISSFELFDSIIKSLVSKPTSKATLYKIRTLVIYIGMENKRIDINTLKISDPENMIINMESRNQIIEMINNCTGSHENNKALILERFGFNGKPKTLQAISKINGRNVEDLRRTETAIIRRLRHRLPANYFK